MTNSIFTRRSLPGMPGLVAVLALSVSALTLTGCGDQTKEKEKATTQAKPALTVSTTALQSLEMNETVRASGGVFAWQEASVGAEVSGLKLERVHADVGEVVHKGQVLAVFASDSVRAELAQQGAALAEAKASFAQAQANAARARQMAASSAVSPQELLAAETTLALAQARVDASQAALEAQRIRLEKTRVLAPDSGVISARSATVGQVANAGGELFRLVRQNRVEWRAEVPAAAMLKMDKGQKAQVELPDGQRMKGQVRQVSPTLNAETRNALVYVDLPADSKARPGMFLSGAIVVGKSPAQVVPGSAVVVRDGTAYLMMVDAMNKVHAVKTRTGRRTESLVEVLPEGPLNPAWHVATQGAGFLNDGDLVKVSKGESK